MRHYKQLQLQYNVLRTGMVRNPSPQHLLFPLLPGHSVLSVLVYGQQHGLSMRNALHSA